MRNYCAAYSSDEHGVSLTTFFNRVDKYEPNILVIRNTNKEVTGFTVLIFVCLSLVCPLLYHIYNFKVFGAYCSASWVKRNMPDEHGRVGGVTRMGYGSWF